MDKEIKVFEGFVGGQYDMLSLHDNYKDAERGQYGGERFYNLFEEFDSKKVRITVEVIEEYNAELEELIEYHIEFFIPEWQRQGLNKESASWRNNCRIKVEKDVGLDRIIERAYGEIGGYPRSASCVVYRVDNNGMLKLFGKGK